MKNIISLMIAMALIVLNATSAMAEIKWVYPGQSPYISITYPDMKMVDGYAMIRVRGYFEELISRNTEEIPYYSYNWDNDAKKLIIEAIDDKEYCTIIVGDKSAKYSDDFINGRNHNQPAYEREGIFYCDIAPCIIDGSLYVQAKAFSGYTLPGVWWSEETNAVHAGS